MRTSPILLVLALVGCAAQWEPADTGNADLFAPEVYLTDPDLGSSWETGAEIPVRATIVDDVDAAAALIVEVRSDLEGVVATPTLTTDGQLDTTITLGPGTHRLTIAAIDTTGLEGTDDTTLRVLDAAAPTQPVMELTPADPVTGDALVATVVVPSVDPEGDELTYTYAWTVDGVDAGIAGDTVDGLLVERGQVWSVTVDATDGTHVSPSFTRQVTIGNAAPDPGDVYLTPDAPSLGDDLTCTHDTPVDAEGDAFQVSYAWWVDGIEQGETGAVLPADALDRGSWVWCEVVLTDAEEARVASDAVQIGNTPPSVGSVTITPADADVTSTLTCSATGVSDPDGDPVALAWRWTIGGTEVGTGRTLGGDAFARGDGVVCEVTPSDPWADGDAVSSATLTVGNSPPEAPEVAFVRDDLVPGVAASCAIVADGVDADGDALAYRWSWTVDGVAAAGTTSSFDTTDLLAGQTLACTATPDDGFDDGAPGGASVVLGAPTTGDVGAADAWAVIAGTTANGAFGKVLDRVDDIDGDGLTELIVAAPRGSGSSKGAGYLYTSTQLSAGGAFTDADAAYSWIGHASGDNLGGARGAAGAGDVDGDGVGDLLLAAPVADGSGADSGTVYLLYGGTGWGAGGDVQSDAAARMNGAAGDWLGARMASGDLDGDGFSDLVLTGPYNDLRASKAGVAAVYFGGTRRLSGTYVLADADALVTGRTADTELGWALDVMGDVNGDGYDELGFGLIYDDTNATEAGCAALVSGGDLAGQDIYDTLAFLVVRGTEAGERFGYDVTGLGDVDDDGFEDVAFGAYLADDTASDSGRVRVFLGAAGMSREVDDDTADLTLTAEATSGQFGSTLYGGFDVDQDGLPDLLAGAPRAANGPGGSSAGTAYLFTGRELGGWGDAGDAALRVFGTAASDWLADEVAGGLDVDGDGYGDFALGAQAADVGATDGGAVYLFTGP